MKDLFEIPPRGALVDTWFAFDNVYSTYYIRKKKFFFKVPLSQYWPDSFFLNIIHFYVCVFFNTWFVVRKLFTSRDFLCLKENIRGE